MTEPRYISFARRELGITDCPKGPKPRPIRCRVNEAGCWICFSHCPRHGAGYPVMSLLGQDIQIGRLLYEKQNGTIPDGLVLRHTCDQPFCVNPAHLIPGTKGDNSRDMVERGRSTRGSRNGNARLTEEQVRAIKASSGVSAREWGQQLGVCKSTILHIWQANTWQHIEGDSLHERRDGNRKLTPEQVREIKQALVTESDSEIGRRYGVTSQAIYFIRRGRNWKGIEP